MYEQRIQFRRDTAIRWAQVNPVLLDGEPGYELDTGYWKVGDGVKSWNELGYKAEDGQQGPLGIQGIQGIQGVKGDKGERGDTGGVGLTGPSNTISIGTVTPGASAGDAAAYLTGTSPSQVLNLVLPKGNKGDQGEKGDTGIQGIQGISGPQGLRGEKGEKGDQGIQGIGGPKGDAAGINVRGVASVWPPSASPAAEDLWILSTPLPPGTPAGFSAGDGALWTGSAWHNVGPIRGPVGPQGIQGVKGDRGDTGSQGHQGAQGVQGAQGLKGDKGDKGDTGSHGIQGPAGPANVLSIGTVASSPPGSQPAVAIIGSSPAQVLSFTFPQPFTNSLSIGTVVDGPSASATITGTAPNQVLNLVLPNPQVVHSTTFITNPQNKTVTVGNSVTLTAEAQSTETPIVYRWQKMGLNWEDIPGAGGNTYTFTPALNESGRQYRCVAATTNFGSAYSQIATLTVKAKSPADGSSWEPADISGAGFAAANLFLKEYPIPYGKGVFTNCHAYSEDGITWHKSVDGVLYSRTLFGNGFFLADRARDFKASSDGFGWSSVGHNDGIPDQNPGAFGDGYFLYRTNEGSLNGLTETVDGISFSSAGQIPSNHVVTMIGFGNGVWVAKDYFGNLFWSTDKITWTDSGKSFAADEQSWHSYNAGMHVIISAGIVALTSADGKTWTERHLAAGGDWTGIAYGNGMFMTVAKNSKSVMTSPDGINWTQKTTLPIANEWTGVSYGANKFVVFSKTDNEYSVVYSG